MRLIANLAVLLLFSVGTFADTHYVSLDSTNPVPPFSSWSTAATNIQNAIDAAADGDTVVVTNGTYVLTGTVSVSKGITLLSVNGLTNTTLDGNESVSTCMQVDSPNAVVRGFTIEGGRINSLSGYGMSAAGVKLVAGELDDCLIISNRLSAAAGYAIGAAGLLILGGTSSNTRVIANDVDDLSGSAVVAGGICCMGGVVYKCMVLGNVMEIGSGSGQAAAGVVCQSGGVVRSSTISSNRWESAYGVLVVGGVLCVHGGLVEDCRVEMNIVKDADGFTTGGVACSDAGVVRNCVVYGNSITGRLNSLTVAGGVSCGVTGLIQNCTIVSNRVWPGRFSPLLGGTGGIYCRDGGRVWNTVVSGNLASNSLMIQGPLSNYTNINNVEWAYCCTKPNPGGEGNITNDPRLVNSAVGDCHLLSTSPCIDSGSTNGAPDCDLDGVPRPLDGNNDGTNVYDIGAYEFVNTNADSDADSLPDYWEVARGLDPRVATTTNGAGGNADGDAADNWSEYVADTDPQSATSVFTVAVSSGTDDWVIQFVSSGARVYSLQYAESLTSPIQWNDVISQTNQTGAGGSMSLSDTNSADFRAYRVRVSFP
jgi:hypothetical protein